MGVSVVMLGMIGFIVVAALLALLVTILGAKKGGDE